MLEQLIVLMKKNALIHQASLFIGVHEIGHNSGIMVRKFQSKIGRAQNEPWCMSFVQYMVGSIDDLFYALVGANHKATRLYPSEHVLTVWEKTPSEFKCCDNPQVGDIVIWSRDTTSKSFKPGHTGLVMEVHGDGTITTIEGNTSQDGEIVREGEGVYRKTRRIDPRKQGIFNLEGFISPW